MRAEERAGSGKVHARTGSTAIGTTARWGSTIVHDGCSVGTGRRAGTGRTRSRSRCRGPRSRRSSRRTGRWSARRSSTSRRSRSC